MRVPRLHTDYNTILFPRDGVVFGPISLNEWHKAKKSNRCAIFGLFVVERPTFVGHVFLFVNMHFHRKAVEFIEILSAMGIP